jgi:hypothetical protein
MSESSRGADEAVENLIESSRQCEVARLSRRAGDGARPKSMRGTLRKRHVLNGLGSLVCVAAFGFVLSSCSINVSLQQQVSRQHEVAACNLLSPPPQPINGSSTFMAIAVKESLISALAKSGNGSLERIARDLRAAAGEETRTGKGGPMIRALTQGVTACHRLGLRTPG